MTVVTSTKSEPVTVYAGIVYAPDQIVEVRAIDTTLPKRKQVLKYWCSANELSELKGLAAWNAAGRNIYVGVACRTGRRQSGNIAFQCCYVIVADFDHMTVDEAWARIGAAGLPTPTMVIDSGHGAHAYWRLSEPITDGEVWRRYQTRLAQLLDCDTTMSDPDQIIRLPGYLNTKEQPHVPCRIVQVDASIVYELADLDGLLPAIKEDKPRVAASPIGERIPEGERNSTLTSLGGTMRKRGMEADAIDAALQVTNANRCDPPLDEAEVHVISQSVSRYAPANGTFRSHDSLNSPPANADGDQDRSLNTLSSHAAWPQPMGAAAFHGLAGDIVRKIEPHSEADPAALLIHALVMFGNIVNRNPHFEADGARHYPNLFAVTVGQTSKGRKGTAQRQVERVFRQVVPEWAEKCVVEGLSTGEGLIWAVRDAIHQRQPVKDKGRVVDYQDVETDPGISDKRLMVGESEFAGTLKVAQREGNTLSPVVRRAWDTGSLRTLTKNAPATATDAHISIIGHITRDELRRCLDTTETANGFCNRFLWLCVRRSKCLPEGGAINDVDFGAEVARLRFAIESASETTLVTRDANARAMWAQVYAKLSDGRSGLLGAVLSRAEAQVMRLAMVYALLDEQRVISVVHLKAALAVWDYCEASAQYIFGASLGDRDADELLRALQAAPDGLSRKQISVDVFNRHRSAEAIERALALLTDAGLASCTRNNTGGRPEERWFGSVGHANKANEANEGDARDADSSLTSLSSPVVASHAEVLHA